MLVFISRYSNLPRIQKYYIITHILRIRNPFPSLPVTNKNNPFLSIFRRSLGISKPQPTSQRASIASQPMMIGSPWIKGGFVKKKLPVFGKIPCKSSPLKYRDLKTLIFFLNSTWNLPWVSTELFVRFDANLSCTWPNQYAKYVLQTHRVFFWKRCC